MGVGVQYLLVDRPRRGYIVLLFVYLPSPLSLFFVLDLSRFDSRRSPRGKEETTRSLPLPLDPVVRKCQKWVQLITKG